jgi:hypothetical protein
MAIEMQQQGKERKFQTILSARFNSQNSKKYFVERFLWRNAIG